MSEPVYEYKKVNVADEQPPTVEAASNRWALMGWRTVAVIPIRLPGSIEAILVERVKPTPPVFGATLLSAEELEEVQQNRMVDKAYE